MEVKELIDYYQQQISHLISDEQRFPHDNLNVEQTVTVYRQFIAKLKQLII